MLLCGDSAKLFNSTSDCILDSKNKATYVQFELLFSGAGNLFYVTALMVIRLYENLAYRLAILLND
jgi:hypothetical protein